MLVVVVPVSDVLEPCTHDVSYRCQKRVIGHMTRAGRLLVSLEQTISWRITDRIGSI